MKWRGKNVISFWPLFHITILRCSTGLNKKKQWELFSHPCLSNFCYRVYKTDRILVFMTDLFPICWSLKLLGTFATDIPDALYLVLIYAFRNAFPKSDLYSVYFYHFVDYYFFCDRLCIKEYKFVKSIILCCKDL